MNIDLSQLSTEEREALLKQAQELNRREREEKMKNYEALREDTIADLTARAKALNAQLAEFKQYAFENMHALRGLLKEYAERSENQADKKNFTVQTDTQKIEMQSADRGTYDERAEQAEGFIFDFIRERYQGDEATKEFILSLLERKQGEFDVKNINKLYKYENKFNDAKYTRACELFKESYALRYSKDYLRFYERDDNGKWQMITLHFAAV